MKEIISRIGVHKVGLKFLEDFNWLEREQPISDYGIDMHIEILNDGFPTGQLIGVQIKSGESYFSETNEKSIVYRGENKHLNYWQFHSIPVLIVLYNPKDDKIYYEKILRNNTVKTESAWKIHIPKTNILTKESKESIEKYYYNRNHFITLELSDSSNGQHRRITAKILVDKSASSRSSLNRMIPQLVDDFKKSDYDRNKGYQKTSQAEIVFLFFYNNVQQAKRGLPFCKAFWNAENCESKVEITNPDSDVDGIQIKWDSTYEFLDDLMQDNQMGKGEYIEIANSSYNLLTEIYKKINISYEKEESITELQNYILSFEDQISQIDELINVKGKFVPFECIDLNKLIIGSSIQLSNIIIVVKDETRNSSNKKFMIKMALDDCQENLKYYEYEYKKIR